MLDLVMAGAAGGLLYTLFKGNRPRFRLNNSNVQNYTPPPAPPPSMYGPQSRRGVLVGINYRGTRAELAGCIHDVQRIAQRLHGTYQLLVLTDDQTGPMAPTKGNIMNALSWLVGGLRPNGKQTVFFHFSGHGSQQEDDDGDEADGLDETICPVDYTRAGMISDDDLKRHFLARIPAGNKLLSIMDCCHSGTVLDLPFYAIARGNEQQCVMMGDQMSDRNRIPCDAIMISGCEDFQTSADVRSVGKSFVELADTRAGGALTSAFLVAVQQNPSHSLASLLFAVRRALLQKGFDQVPQISASLPYDVHRTVFDLLPESIQPALTAAAQAMQQPPQQQQHFPQQQQQYPQQYPQQQQQGYPQQQGYQQQYPRQQGYPQQYPPQSHPSWGQQGRPMQAQALPQDRV